MSSDLVASYSAALTSTDSSFEIKNAFDQRLAEGNLTRDGNDENHFCTYFAAYDPTAQKVFLGHHKKSGLWLFNGGHIDRGETPDQAVRREIFEEWGVEASLFSLAAPSLLTLTEIKSSAIAIPCKLHYDIWYFIPVEKTTFSPDQTKLAEEFHETRWLGKDGALQLTSDPNTITVIEKLLS